jgi:hypothetical protein
MARKILVRLRLACLFCGGKVIIHPPVLEAMHWELLCPVCVVTTILPITRYSTTASVEELWQRARSKDA